MHLIVGVSLSQKTKKSGKVVLSGVQNNNEKLKYNVVYYVMYFRYIFEFFIYILKYFK
jgi:hypothetical protein